MDATGSSFANQRMLFSNPQIQTVDQREFTNPQGDGYADLMNRLSVESYKAPVDRRRNINGFVYDNELSDRRHAIYQHKYNKRVVMANRGTVPTKLRDLYSDAALTLGTFRRTDHYKNAVRKYEEVQNKYGKGQRYHLTGHSLGAYTTVALHHRFPHSTSTSVGFNTPGSLPGLLSSGYQKITGHKTKTQKKVQENHVSYINSLDPVSILARHRTHTKREKNFSLNPHSLGQWSNYD